MSQLVGRISKLSRRVDELSTAARPYLLLRDEIVGNSSSERVVNLNLLDPCKQETVKIPDQILPTGLSESLRIGSSKGWVALMNCSDLKLRLTNIFNPFASTKSIISLPPLDKCYKGSIARVSSVSLSASPNHPDCVVAAKLSAPIISLCRPGDSEWTHIETPTTFFTSMVMYSVKDRKFYLYSPDTGPTDQIKTCSDFPPVSPYRRFPFSDIPKTTEDLIHSCPIWTQYLVEAPSGDSLIVFWCMEGIKKETTRHSGGPWCETKAFMVFKQDPEKRKSSYTQDIGDLCIFLGHNEAFCVSATQYPGLNPNSVYFQSFDTGFGFYDLSSNTVHKLTHLAPTSTSTSTSHLWLAPL